MKVKITWALWAILYVLCVFLGMLGTQQGVGAVLFTLSSLIFFIPGGLLLYWGITEGNRKQVLGVRITAICSLSLTLIFLVANFCSVFLSEAAGNALHIFLVIVSAPMACSGYWVLSLFLWACLLMGSFIKPKK